MMVKGVIGMKKKVGLVLDVPTLDGGQEIWVLRQSIVVSVVEEIKRFPL